jgi:hypothetical protein
LETKANRSKNFPCIVAIIAAIIVVVLVVSVVAYIFISSQSSDEILSANIPPSQVSISYPNEGAQLAEGEPLFVNAIAIGPREFLSLELWVDGELVGVQAAPSGGVRPFSTSFLWVPKEPGYHSLNGAAIDFEGQKTISPQVVVVISQEGGGGDIITPSQDDSVSVFPPPPGGAYTPPNPPDADDSVGPANVSSNSPGDLADDPNGNEPPAAPELVANAGQCGANLSFRDLSDNEQGFIVHRQTVNAPTWEQIAILNSQSENDWLTYTDEGTAGALTYYVSAFNGNGESASNLALVNVDPADCPDEPGEATVITVEVANLMPELAAEMSYCYKSTDGINWSRWPQFGFLTPGDENTIQGEQILQMPSTAFNGQPAVHSLDLYMECWGWQGGALQFLGDFFIEGMELDDYGSQIVPGNGISAEIVVNTAVVAGETEFYPMSGGDQELGEVREIKMKLFSPEIPGVFLWYTNDYQKCDEQLLSYDPAASTLAWCRNPYPQYGDSQPYLIWFPGPGSGDMFDLRPVCKACKSVEELLALAEETGGQVGIEVVASSSLGRQTWSLNMPRPPLEIVPPLWCTGEMWFNVSLWYRPGLKGQVFDANNPPSIETYYGPPSNWVSLPCYVEPTHSNIRYLDITFKNLVLSNVDDDDIDIGTGCIGPGSCDDVEVYGYFKVIPPGSEVTLSSDPNLMTYLHLATWDEQGDYCPDDVTDYFTTPGSGCPPHLFNGSFDLSTLYLCQSSYKRRCETGFLTNNNTLRVAVKHGDAIGLKLEIYDWDDGSDNDLVCEQTVFTPTQSLEQWSNYHKVHPVDTTTTDSGQCSIQVEIKAVDP